MDFLVKGMANAYQNQLNWQAKHRRDIDAGDTSFLGMNTLLPHIQNMWNRAMFVPAIIKGCVFGEALQDIPSVTIAENLKETQWGKDMQTYLDTEREINKLKVQSVEDQIMGICTLNLGRFNNGRAAQEAIAHDEARLSAVILPLKGQAQGRNS
jgi:hypothetical protein